MKVEREMEILFAEKKRKTIKTLFQFFMFKHRLRRPNAYSSREFISLK